MSSGSGKHDQDKSGSLRPDNTSHKQGPTNWKPFRESVDRARPDQEKTVRESEKATITSRERDDSYGKP